MEQEGIASTETDDFETITFWSKPFLAQESLLRELPPPIQIVVHHALALPRGVLDKESVGKNSWKEKFEGLKEE